MTGRTFDPAFVQLLGVSHVVEVGVVEQGFGWDAPDVQTRASQSRTLFHAHCVHAQLSCFNGSHVTTRSTADHADVRFCGKRPIEGCSGRRRVAPPLIQPATTEDGNRADVGRGS